MIRNALIVNKKRIQSLKELRDNFNLLEVMAYVRNGRLAKWLMATGETELQKKLEALDLTQDFGTIEKQVINVLDVNDGKKDFLGSVRLAPKAGQLESVINDL